LGLKRHGILDSAPHRHKPTVADDYRIDHDNIRDFPKFDRLLACENVLARRMPVVAKAFPLEFRRDVVAVARQRDAPIAQVGCDFGILES
jgi:hypothetical protein